MWTAGLEVVAMARKKTTKTKHRGVRKVVGVPDLYLLRIKCTLADGSVVDTRREVEAVSADEALRKRLTIIDEAKAPAESEPARRVPTFSDCVDSWIKRHVRLKRWKPTTFDKNTKHAGALVDALGHLLICDLRLEHIEEHLAHMNGTENPLGRPYAASTIRTRVTVLCAILNDAVKRGHLAKGAIDTEGLKPELPKARKVLSPDDVDAFLLAMHEVDLAPAHTNDGYARAKWYPITLFLARTGCRVGEAKALTWDKIDRRARTVVISATYSGGHLIKSTKNGEPRTIPLTPDLFEVLEAERRRQKHEDTPNLGNLVFPAPRSSGHLQKSVTDKPFAKACELAGIDRKVTPHWLRHSMNNAVRRLGGAVLAKALLGHSDKSMTGHYSDVTPAEMLEVIVRAFPQSGTKVGVMKKAANACTVAASFGACSVGYFRAGDEIRTRDVNLGKVALYH